MARVLPILVVGLCSAGALVVPTGRASVLSSARYSAAMPHMMADDESPPPRVNAPSPNRPPGSGMTPEERERADLYAGPSFELDAVSITALLGAAIAFQFFVLANL